MAMTEVEVAGRDGRRVRLPARRLEALDARVAGQLLRPDDRGWEEAVRLRSGMGAKSPALVVQPVSARDDDGAVGNRDARYVSGFSGTWPAGTDAERHVAWVRASRERIRPFSTGGNYVSFQLADDDAGRTAAAYGRNYARLRRLKAAYDPGNPFRVNRNIPPAARWPARRRRSPHRHSRTQGLRWQPERRPDAKCRVGRCLETG
jgi:hypothetical protein